MCSVKPFCHLNPSEKGTRRIVVTVWLFDRLEVSSGLDSETFGSCRQRGLGCHEHEKIYKHLWCGHVFNFGRLNFTAQLHYSIQQWTSRPHGGTKEQSEGINVGTNSWQVH